MAASEEISWPRAGMFLAAYGEILTAADRTSRTCSWAWSRSRASAPESEPISFNLLHAGGRGAVPLNRSPPGRAPSNVGEG